jgi:hypothetical protein
MRTKDVFKPNLPDPEHPVESVTDPSKPKRIKSTCLNCEKTFLAKGRV